MTAAVTFTYSTYALELEQPELGYTTKIDLPFDMIDLDDGTIDSYDNGITYDKYSCEVVWRVNADTAALLLAFFETDVRGQSVVMTLASGSGFFPFGPHKGDVGAFTVAAEIIERSAPLSEPFLWYEYKIRLTKSGSFPSYSIPTEVSEGDTAHIIAWITAVRFPPNGFSPAFQQAISVSFGESDTAYFVDKTSGGDSRTTKFTLESNQTKTANIIKNIVDTERNTQFAFAYPNNFDPFGLGSLTDTYADVMLSSSRLEVMHIEYNHFSFSLSLLYVYVGGIA